MAYTPATKLPQLNFAQWSRPDAPNPRLAAPIDVSSTTLVFTSAPLDYLGNVITGDFLMRSTNKNNYTELMYIPAGAMSVDGLTATGVIRGVRVSGLDYTTGDANYADVHEGDSPIGFAISAVYESILAGIFSGTIATNGLSLRIGDGTDSNTTIYASGVSETGWLRKNATSGKAEYSNDGTNWLTFDAISTSNVVIASSTDTTPGTLDAKMTVSSGSGATVTKTLVNPAGNESINIDVALDTSSLDSASDRSSSFTSAYLTSGAAVFADYTLWTPVTDGAFQITIDGVALDVTGIDFSGVTNMGGVASIIQAALRAESGGSETCTWTGTLLVIASVLTTSVSEVTVTTAGTAGTDISGAGLNSYMDCDTGNGVETLATFDVSNDAGKLVALASDGYLDNSLLSLNAPIHYTFDTESAPFGDSTSQFDITNTAGDTYRYTYDGTGTDPGITSITFPVGGYVYAGGSNFNAANQVFGIITASATNYFEIENTSGVVESNKTLGTGLLTITENVFIKNLGDSTSQFDITNTAGDTYRYTWDGNGTDPAINSDTLKVGAVLLINGEDFAGGNKGAFKVTTVGTDYFEVTNTGGVVESNKLIGTGEIKKLLSHVVVKGVGGGGASYECGSDNDASGGGGGAGYCESIISADDLGEHEYMVIGDGGIGDDGTAGLPTNGVNTIFGSHFIAEGGLIGTSDSVGGKGGDGTGAEINITGSDGFNIENSYSGSESIEYPGMGGASQLSGSVRGNLTQSTGVTGYDYGGGASGARSNNGGSSQNGADGGPGVVFVTEFY